MIKELRAKLEAATPGPWRALPNGVFGGPTMPRKVGIVYWDDAALIVSAINALPALLAVVEAALERDGCSEVCSAMKPYRGCTCGAEALDRALASLTRNDEVDRG